MLSPTEQAELRQLYLMQEEQYRQAAAGKAVIVSSALKSTNGPGVTVHVGIPSYLQQQPRHSPPPFVAEEPRFPSVSSTREPSPAPPGHHGEPTPPPPTVMREDAPSVHSQSRDPEHFAPISATPPARASSPTPRSILLNEHAVPAVHTASIFSDPSISPTNTQQSSNKWLSNHSLLPEEESLDGLALTQLPTPPPKPMRRSRRVSGAGSRLPSEPSISASPVPQRAARVAPPPSLSSTFSNTTEGASAPPVDHATNSNTNTVRLLGPFVAVSLPDGGVLLRSPSLPAAISVGSARTTNSAGSDIAASCSHLMHWTCGSCAAPSSALPFPSTTPSSLHLLGASTLGLDVSNGNGNGVSSSAALSTRELEIHEAEVKREIRQVRRIRQDLEVLSRRQTRSPSTSPRDKGSSWAYAGSDSPTHRSIALQETSAAGSLRSSTGHRTSHAHSPNAHKVNAKNRHSMPSTPSYGGPFSPQEKSSHHSSSRRRSEPRQRSAPAHHHHQTSYGRVACVSVHDLICGSDDSDTTE